MPAGPSPRIGFMGTVNPKIDLSIVLTLSEQRPDWHWVFVGDVVVAVAEVGDGPARAWIRDNGPGAPMLTH